MALVMTPIYTQTVGASATYTVAFNNIPQFYTDLLIKVSGRDTNAATATNLFFRFNNDTSSIYSSTRFFGNGSSVNNDRQTNENTIRCAYPAANATANTFGSVELYMPNYAGSNFKSMVLDAVTENNATSAEAQLVAGLYRSTSAITSIQILAGIQFVQNSTFSIYGIIRSGA